jgi:hypothetical protein
LRSGATAGNVFDTIVFSMPTGCRWDLLLVSLEDSIDPPWFINLLF